MTTYNPKILIISENNFSSVRRQNPVSGYISAYIPAHISGTKGPFCSRLQSDVFDTIFIKLKNFRTGLDS
jgi:hypothetical protein